MLENNHQPNKKQTNLKRNELSGELPKLDIKEIVNKAKEGDEKAQIKLAEMFLTGDEVPQDYKKAFKWFSKAAQNGNAEVQYNIGVMYYYGHGVTKDLLKSAEWFKKSSDQGCKIATQSLHRMYKQVTGLKKIIEGIERGDSDALVALGLLYSEGETDGIPRDYNRAIKLYTKAAKQGSAMAKHNLGVMYCNGNGVPKDYTKALEWFTKAARQDYAKAYYYIGVMYYKGLGVSKDKGKVIENMIKAAELGYDVAQYAVGLIYFEGKLTQTNYSEASKWFKKASKNGNYLAFCYLTKYADLLQTKPKKDN